MVDTHPRHAWMRAKRSAFDFDFLLIFRGGRARKLSEAGRGGFAGCRRHGCRGQAPGVRALWLRSTASQAPERTAASGWAGLGFTASPRTHPARPSAAFDLHDQPPRHEGLSRWPSPSPRARPAAPPGSVPRCHAGTRARPFRRNRLATREGRHRQCQHVRRPRQCRGIESAKAAGQLRHQRAVGRAKASADAVGRQTFRQRHRSGCAHALAIARDRQAVNTLEARNVQLPIRASIADRICVSSAGARSASTCSVETGSSGRSSASAMPCAMAIARRTPVKAPGPRLSAMPSSWRRLMPASASSASAHGRLSSACRRGAISKRSSTCPSTCRATEQASVAVSKASSFIGSGQNRGTWRRAPVPGPPEGGGWNGIIGHGRPLWRKEGLHIGQAAGTAERWQ